MFLNLPVQRGLADCAAEEEGMVTQPGVSNTM